MAKKVMLVFGTHPEAIKFCPLVNVFQKYSAEFETIVCVTDQYPNQRPAGIRALIQGHTAAKLFPGYDGIVRSMKESKQFNDLSHQ